MSDSPEANLAFPRMPLTVGPWRNARRRHTLQRLAGRNPQWWMILLAVGAWIVLAAAPHGHAAHGSAHHGAGRDSLALAAMVVAMMLPLTLGPVRELARSSSWRRRVHAAAAFLAGYLAVWMLAMLAIDAAWTLTASRTGSVAASVTAAAAAVLWQFAWRARLQPTHHDAPVTRKWLTDASCARLGVVAAGGCVASCWALMAACVAFAHSLPVMMALFCVQMIGRHRPATSPAITALAVLGVCAASLAARMAGHHAM
jgi:Predicted metal-binding integral membrane protein (DUF2182)